MGVKQKQKQSNMGQYRLLLFVNKMDPQSKTVYIISTSNVQNKNLWSKARSCCDDGSISIDTIVGIMSPHPITTFYNNDIPVIYCDGGLLVVQEPGNLIEIKINNDLAEHITMGFYTKCKTELRHANVIPSKCNGYFYDRQMINDLYKNKWAVGVSKQVTG